MSQKRAQALDIKVLEDREVLFCFDESKAHIDIETGTFVGDWHSAGIEPTDSTHGETREVNSNKTELTGGQTATSYTAGAVTGTVDLVPGTAVLRHVEWPDTTEKDGVLYLAHTSRVAKAIVARVYKYQSGVVEIKVSREPALLTVQERTYGTDPQPRSLEIDYQNGEDEQMFEQRFYVVKEDGTVREVTPKIFRSVEDLAAKVESGEAFVPAASAAGLDGATVTRDGELVEVEAKKAMTPPENDTPGGADPVEPEPSPEPEPETDPEVPAPETETETRPEPPVSETAPEDPVDPPVTETEPETDPEPSVPEPEPETPDEETTPGTDDTEGTSPDEGDSTGTLPWN